MLFAAQAAVAQDDIMEMLYWGGGLIFAMLLLFVLQKAIRHGIESRVRSIHRQAGIDFDDVNRMSQTGLLTEEEKAKVKKAIAKTYSLEARETVERNIGDTVYNSLSPAPTAQSSVNADSPEMRRRATEVDAPRQSGAAADGSTRPRPSSAGTAGQKAIDLDTLLERGLITPEEYERLKSQ